MPRTYKPVEERFWDKVDTTGKGCWPFTGYVAPNGYGRFKYGDYVTNASRVAWQLVNGPIPDGQIILHTCDNPTCCRPDHLRLGTYKDNSADAIAKGRHAHGETNGRSKLTAKDVLEIRQIYETTGISMAKLARLYGVSNRQLRDIINGIYWRHVM